MRETCFVLSIATSRKSLREHLVSYLKIKWIVIRGLIWNVKFLNNIQCTLYVCFFLFHININFALSYFFICSLPVNEHSPRHLIWLVQQEKKNHVWIFNFQKLFNKINSGYITFSIEYCIFKLLTKIFLT